MVALTEESTHAWLESLPTPAWVLDAAGNAIALNAAWSAFTGLPGNEGTGYRWRNTLDPAEADAFLALREAKLAAGEPWSATVRLRGASGQFRTHSVRLSPTRDASGAIAFWVGIAVDIEDNVESQRRARQLFETVATNTASGLLLMDPDGTALYVNPAWEAMTGVSFEAMQGRPAHYSVHHTRPDGTPYPMDECPIDRANAELVGIRDVQDYFVRPDGTFYPVSCSAMPLERDGVRLGAVVEVRDISAAHANEQALRDALAAKNMFLALVSHELRTPLTMIGGNAHILRDRYERLSTEDREAVIDEIVQNNNRLTRIVENMLALSRIDRGIEVESEPALVIRIAQEVVARHRRALPGREFSVIERTAPKPVNCVPGYVEQVIDNLLTNAEKYSDGPIEVSVDRQPDHVSCTVRDRGRGFDATTVGRMFDPFFRADSEAAAPGLGIGLAVCKRLIEAQSGVMWARNREGGGAEVGFSLPATPIGDDEGW